MVHTNTRPFSSALLQTKTNVCDRLVEVWDGREGSLAAGETDRVGAHEAKPRTRKKSGVERMAGHEAYNLLNKLGSRSKNNPRSIFLYFMVKKAVDQKPIPQHPPTAGHVFPPRSRRLLLPLR